MRIKSGGGYNAKVTSSVKASAKVEPRSRAIDPERQCSMICSEWN